MGLTVGLTERNTIKNGTSRPEIQTDAHCMHQMKLQHSWQHPILQFALMEGGEDHHPSKIGGGRLMGDMI